MTDDSARVRLYHRVWEPLAPLSYTLIAFLGSLSPSHKFWYRGGNTIAVHPFDLENEREIGRAETTAKGLVEKILWGVAVYASLFLGIGLATDTTALVAVSSLSFFVVAILLATFPEGLDSPSFEPMHGGEEV